MADLLAVRYPALAVAREAWRCGRDVRVLENLPGDGAAVLRLDGEDVVNVVECDPRLVPLLGRQPGEGAGLLGENVAAEAGMALETGRELLIEDTLALPTGATRVAKLYLPFHPDRAEVLLVVAVVGPLPCEE